MLKIPFYLFIHGVHIGYIFIMEHHSVMGMWTSSSYVLISNRLMYLTRNNSPLGEKKKREKEVQSWIFRLQIPIRIIYSDHLHKTDRMIHNYLNHNFWTFGYTAQKRGLWPIWKQVTEKQLNPLESCAHDWLSTLL